jgi:peptidyl-prolyl cis-trans isomerase SurA
MRQRIAFSFVRAALPPFLTSEAGVFFFRHLFTLCCVILLACPPLIGHAASPAPPARAVNKVVAVVNGEMITQFDLELAAMPAIVDARLDPRNPSDADKVQDIMRQALERMISDTLLVQEAERMKISASEADVQDELKRMVENGNLPEEELFGHLARQGMDRPAVLERLRRRVLQQRLMGNMVNRKVIVTKDDVAKYFEQHKGEISVGGWVEFAVLAYGPQTKAADWAARMKAGKVTFEEAVRQVSVGPNREQGGRLERMSPNSALAPIRMRLEQLEPGQVSEVFDLNGVNTQIKLVAEEKARQLETLEEAAPVIEERLRLAKLEERYKEYLAQLRAKALVEVRL